MTSWPGKKYPATPLTKLQRSISASPFSNFTINMYFSGQLIFYSYSLKFLKKWEYLTIVIVIFYFDEIIDLKRSSVLFMTTMFGRMSHSLGEVRKNVGRQTSFANNKTKTW